MINNATLMGRLTRDPELKTTNNGTSVVSFTIAVDRNYQNGNGERPTDFINITAWGQTAEFVSRYFQKGDMIALAGKIQTRKYQDKSGNTRTAFEVVANQVSFCGGKRQDNNSNYQNNYQSQPANNGYQVDAPQRGYQNQPNNYRPIRNQPVNPPQNVVDDWDAESEDDLPF